MSNLNKAENIVLVDEKDHPIGVADKLTAHQQGLLHRAFSVFVFRQDKGQLELLLQQRQYDKYHSGGLWTNTCCSHPRPDEPIVAAGKRRLMEEMNIALAELHSVGTFVYKAEFDNGLIEHEYDHILLGYYPRGAQQTINVNPTEVAAYRWVDLQALDAMLADTPSCFTFWFQQAWDCAKQHLSILESFCTESIMQYV